MYTRGGSITILMESGRSVVVEANSPEDMDSADDLPDSVENALPDDAEELFFKELQKAYEQNPDADDEGEWWAQAWDKVNDEFEKDLDDRGDSWEPKEESSDINDRIEGFLGR